MSYANLQQLVKEDLFISVLDKETQNKFLEHCENSNKDYSSVLKELIINFLNKKTEDSQLLETLNKEFDITRKELEFLEQRLITLVKPNIPNSISNASTVHKLIKKNSETYSKEELAEEIRYLTYRQKDVLKLIGKRSVAFVVQDIYLDCLSSEKLKSISNATVRSILISFHSKGILNLSSANLHNRRRNKYSTYIISEKGNQMYSLLINK